MLFKEFVTTDILTYEFAEAGANIANLPLDWPYQSKYIYDKFKEQFHELSAIEMSETPKTNCRYEPS